MNLSVQSNVISVGEDASTSDLQVRLLLVDQQVKKVRLLTDQHLQEVNVQEIDNEPALGTRMEGGGTRIEEGQGQ